MFKKIQSLKFMDKNLKFNFILKACEFAEH